MILGKIIFLRLIVNLFFVNEVKMGKQRRFLLKI